MALTPISVPAFPDVPLAAGVPAVARSALAAASTVSLLTSDLVTAFGLDTVQWGIFTTDGQPYLIGDSVVGVAYKREYQVASFPIEAGSFGSYNKTQTPFDARVSFTKGGTDAERAEFLAAVGAMAASLDLYSVVVPEFTYPNANAVHFDYQRGSRNGATLLTVDVWLQEIRPATTTNFTSTKEDGGASPQNGGTVQPADPTLIQSATFGDLY